MKALIAVFLVCIAVWVTKQIYRTYQKSEQQRLVNPTDQSATTPAPTSTSAALAGLPPSLETSLANAERQGAPGLREWLRNYQTLVRDPRLAAIQLDYVVLISGQDPAEARRIFKDVKNRTPTFSPIYDRVKRLEKTFQ